MHLGETGERAPPHRYREDPQPHEERKQIKKKNNYLPPSINKHYYIKGGIVTKHTYTNTYKERWGSGARADYKFLVCPQPHAQILIFFLEIGGLSFVRLCARGSLAPWVVPAQSLDRPGFGPQSMDGNLLRSSLRSATSQIVSVSNRGGRVSVLLPMSPAGLFTSDCYCFYCSPHCF